MLTIIFINSYCEEHRLYKSGGTDHSSHTQNTTTITAIKKWQTPLVMLAYPSRYAKPTQYNGSVGAIS